MIFDQIATWRYSGIMVVIAGVFFGLGVGYANFLFTLIGILLVIINMVIDYRITGMETYT